MNELKWVLWGRHGYYVERMEDTHGRFWLVDHSTCWYLYRATKATGPMQFWHELSAMPAPQAKQAAALMIMMGGSDE